MQAAMQNQMQQSATARGLSISYAWIAYGFLLALALWLRIAELDTIALSGDEARQALAAWRALYPALPGTPIVPESPLLFALHGVSFSILGASEFSTRIFTALAGALLVVMPVLFRDILGRARAFLFSLILAFSPVLLIASRVDAPAVWALLSATLGLWALWRWWRQATIGSALLATALFVSMVLLTDPAGLVLGLVLAGAAALALAWNRVDDPDHDPLPDIAARLRGWPWQSSLLVGLLTVFAISTGFMLYLPGLSAVSELLGVGVAGFVTPQPGAPPLFALLAALFYEPVLWLFAFVAVWLLARRGTLGLLDRFFASWLVLAGAASLIYQGTGPAHALWLIIPMTALTTAAVVDMLAADDHPFLDVPWWGRWVTALALCGLLMIFAINFQAIARAFLSVPGGGFIDAPLNPINMVWSVISLLFIIVGYFLTSSLWGATAALKGGGLGLLAFALVTSLGSGWAAAVNNAGNPIEFWHRQPTGRESFLLRDTLLELTRRESGGFPELPVFVQAEDDGVVAWLLRDFVNVAYVTQATEGRTQEVVLLPILAEPPDLGGSYVGQDFIIERLWQMQTLEGLDFIPWWLQRRTRMPDLPSRTMVLWLRQDIYDGAPFDPGG